MSKRFGKYILIRNMKLKMCKYVLLKKVKKLKMILIKYCKNIIYYSKTFFAITSVHVYENNIVKKVQSF
jgi:hypothetical protein